MMGAPILCARLATDIKHTRAHVGEHVRALTHEPTAAEQKYFVQHTYMLLNVSLL